ncbi:MAG: hypothetical protein ABI867_32840 [Kofleriaceae bacterium]
MAIAPWAFANPPSRPRNPEVILAAFGSGALAEDIPLSLSRFGIASAEAAQAVDIREIEAARDPEWFAAWRAGSLRAIAEQDLDGELAALDAADRLHMITAAPAEPTDLAYLQTAWGIARYLVARGAAIVLDVHAMTYHHAAAIPAADAPLDVTRELRIIFETTATRPDGAHALHTRGMRKFGVPDLVALCTDDDMDLVGAVIKQVACNAALGAMELDHGTAVDLDESATWVIANDEHGVGGLLGLNNDARVLVDDDGAHLVGERARIEAARRRS